MILFLKLLLSKLINIFLFNKRKMIYVIFGTYIIYSKLITNTLYIYKKTFVIINNYNITKQNKKFLLKNKSKKQTVLNTIVTIKC